MTDSSLLLTPALSLKAVPRRVPALAIGLRSLLAGLLLWAGAPSAQAATSNPGCPPAAVLPTEAQMSAGLRHARDRGFLWRLTRNGRVSYLYGTLHVGQADWLYPGPRVMKAAREVDVFAVELDLQDPDVAARMQQSLAAAPRHALPEDLQRRLDVQRRRQCVTSDVAERLPPEFLVNLLALQAARRDGLHTEFGIDAVYTALARSLHKDVVSLETPELQLGLLLGRDAQDAQTKVAQGLAGLESPAARSITVRMGRMWSESRFDELRRYREWCACMRTASDRAWMAQLLDGRNPELAARIDALHLGGQRVFAAVGALHMIGPKGLPALMARRGYRVERLDAAGRHPLKKRTAANRAG